MAVQPCLCQACSEILNTGFLAMRLNYQFTGTQEYLNKDWPSREECDEHVKKVPDAICGVPVIIISVIFSFRVPRSI